MPRDWQCGAAGGVWGGVGVAWIQSKGDLHRRQNMSGIVRVKKYKPGEFWQSLKAPFQDKLLSFGARGILAYLLTHPDGWEVRNKDLYDKSPPVR